MDTPRTGYAWSADGACLASQPVKDLTVGSGIGFVDAGEHELKGVPERWRRYRVTS